MLILLDVPSNSGNCKAWQVSLGIQSPSSKLGSREIGSPESELLPVSYLAAMMRELTKMAKLAIMAIERNHNVEILWTTQAAETLLGISALHAEICVGHGRRSQEPVRATRRTRH